MSIVPISRTVGERTIVDEMVVKFTHTWVIDYLLPGIAPTDFNVAFSGSFPERGRSAWVLMTLRVHDWTGGWCIGDGEAWSADGLLLGVVRQMRRVFVRGRGAEEGEGRQILRLPHGPGRRRGEVVGAVRQG